MDSLDSKEEWQTALGRKVNAVSIFFAPNHPVISLNRMIVRARICGDTMTKEEVARRCLESAERVKGVWQFDYWLDTTCLNLVFPYLASIINFESFGCNGKAGAVLIQESKDEINMLIRRYSVNLIPYLDTVSVV
ncbi:hypothetical protein A2188_00130 [Candidatus Woesebacteria bacterium RIFOXYA1_FULL_43_9]|uniref:Uncharacterized protein n=1 Tax=Candidatus Woesebacteria bacterium RIFOXYA1_FULL_43_9 TaxID=1802534 RepID=A0A1F8CKT0_9BACT|nr:MAG: hypothetical protein A2188_00130 [Candidatus Woesebacteria bacterium RIFOXYA1_FULL_43_9]